MDDLPSGARPAATMTRSPRAARYLVRFDDICPTMAWATWARVEAALDRHGVRPILAVVPDNRDPGLQVDDADPRFWDLVRAWQAKGWAIALHGHTHVYTTLEAGLVPLNRRSEFAGLPRDEQKAKLAAALAVFAREGVRADAWVAPAHSFDDVTIDVLHEAGLRTISDGLHHRAAIDRRGMVWVPQQLWAFQPRRRGLWTVCNHVNSWTAKDLARFEEDLQAYSPLVIGLDEAVASAQGARMGSADHAAARLRLAQLRLRHAGARWLRRSR